jgi:D-beta-D-heptose 7-phosphate kinase/D-beta-D-heptose 1-phosphate adenosyltransferase
LLGQRNQPVQRFPARARRVCDVTGAGDVVLALAGLCRAARLAWPVTARLAGLAAGLKVERPATYAVQRDDLRAALAGPPGTAGKLISLEGMEMLAQQYRRRGLSVVLSNGCFDLLHAGHAAYLEQARRLGDVLVVAVNRDASVRRLKGLDRPIVGEAERAALVAALGCVDHVLLFDEPTPHEVLRRVRPDVLVKGGDYRPDQVVGREVVEGYGGRVCLAGRQPGLSTSRLIEAVLRARPGAEQ